MTRIEDRGLLWDLELKKVELNAQSVSHKIDEQTLCGGERGSKSGSEKKWSILWNREGEEEREADEATAEKEDQALM